MKVTHSDQMKTRLLVSSLTQRETMFEGGHHLQEETAALLAVALVQHPLEKSAR
jgi:hypothetical protein